MKKSKFLVGLSILASVALFSRPVFSTVTNQVVSTTTAFGTGATVNYVIGFDFRDNSQVVVTKYDTSVVPTSHVIVPQGSGASKFTVTGGNPGTTVHMGTAPTTSQYLIITRDIPLTQNVVFDPASPFPYVDMGTQMDNVTLELQNLNSAILNAGIATGGAGAVSSALPTGVANNFLGWESTGASVVNIPNSAPSTNDILQWNGSNWVTYNLSQGNLISTINSGGSQMQGAVGGTGVNNSGTLTWNNNLQFTTTGDTNVTLPTSGTLLSGTANTGNVANTFVKRDGSGNFSAATITASLTGNVTGNLTGNVTGNASGTSNNVTGTVAIGHGGTGATTRQAAINALTGTQSSGKFLRSDGTDATLQVLQIGDVPQGFSRLKLAQDTANTIVMNDGSGNMSVLVPGTSGYVATSNGTTWVSAPVGSGLLGLFPYGVDTGAANAYVVASPNPPVLSYVAGIGVSFLAANSNTGGATIDVSGIGPVSITAPGGGPLVAGDIIAGQMVDVQYDGTTFQLISQQGPAVSANTVNTIVKRDASGNFAAGTITGSLTGHASLDAQKSNNLSDLSSVQTALNNLAQSVTSGQYLRGNGTNIAMSAISAADVPTLNQNTTGTAANITGIALVANGGTGLSTLTSNNLLVGNGTGNITFIAPGSNGSVLTSNGTTWSAQAAAVSGITQLTGDVTAGAGSGSQAATIAGHAVTNAKAAQMAAHTHKGNNTGSTADAIDLTQAQLTADLNQFSSTLQGVVPASGGGTTNFLRADGNWAVAGTGSVSSVALTVPSFLSVSGSPITSSGTLGVTFSGTAIPVANGGTGLTAGTSGGVPYYNSSSTLASSGALAASAVVLGGGAGASPTALASPTASAQVLGNESGVPVWHTPAINNLVANSDAEINANGFTAFADGASVTPVALNGGSPNTTCTRTTSSPLEGAGSFLMTVTTGASRQGEGCAWGAITVPPSPDYYTRGLTITFPFTTTGTLVDGDVQIYAYDITNSRLITPVWVSKVLGASGIVVANFPISTNTVSLRFAMYLARTSTGALTVTADNVRLIPTGSVVTGVQTTDWSSYTPTISAGFGTTSGVSFEWRQEGDSYHIRGTFTSGTAAASLGTFTLPNGAAINTTKMTLQNTTSNAGERVGWFLENTTNETIPIVTATGTSSTLVYIGNTINSASNLVPTNVSSSAGSSLFITLDFTVPIAGLSATQNIATSTVFNVSNYLAAGTRVTGSAPTALGQYRSYLRNSSAGTYTETNGSPTTGPTAADGILIYKGTAWGTVNSNNQPTKYDIFVGLGKSVQWRFWSSAGRTGFIDTTLGLLTSTTRVGYSTFYDPATGIATIFQPSDSTLTSGPGTGIDGTGATLTSNVYFDIVVSDNPVGVGATNVSTNAATVQSHLESAYILNSAGTYSISSQTGTWIASLTKNSTGDVTLNFTSGEFSGASTCFCMSSSGNRACNASTAVTDPPPSTTSYRINMFNAAAGTAIDTSFSIMCMGPR